MLRFVGLQRVGHDQATEKTNKQIKNQRPSSRGLMSTSRNSQDFCCQCPGPKEGYCQLTSQQERPTHSQASLTQSFVGSLSFPLSPSAHKILFVPSKSLCFPQSCGSSAIKYPDLQSQILQGFPAPSLYTQVGKSDVVPTTFITV